MSDQATPPPTWLPAEIGLDGAWDEIRNRLDTVFQRDSAQGLQFRGLPVWHDQRRLEDHLPEGFWHITHRDQWLVDPMTRRKEKKRIFDPGRSRRLAWLKPMLEHPLAPAVLTWDFIEDDGRESTYVWLRKPGYLAVLARQNTRTGCVYKIISAYSVDYVDKVRQLEDKYRRRKV